MRAKAPIKPAAKPATPPIPTKGGKPGRKAYEATDEHRTLVRLLSAGGIVQERIAQAVDVPLRTMKRHYRRELQLGQTEIDALAVNTLVAAMRRGGKEAVTAAKWWTQSRMSWSEKILVDDGKADQPMRVIVELLGDPGPEQNGHVPVRGMRMPMGAVDLMG